MNSINITMLQMEIRKGDFESNCRNIMHLLHQSSRQPDLIILPEMWSVDFDYRRMKQHGKQWKDTVSFLRHLALSSRAVIVGGSIPEVYEQRLFNTSFVLNPDGHIQDCYRKMHLVSHRHPEGRMFHRGNRIPQFHVHNIPFGIAVCYDIMFPELTRGIALQGSQFVVVPAQYSNPFFHQWQTLLQARAMENQVFVVSANRVGPNYYGHSCLISPSGETLYEADDRQQLIEVQFSPEEAEEKRKMRNHIHQIHHSAMNKWVYPQNFIGVGGLVEREGRILMVRQNYGKLKNYWLLPGGHLDKGEPPREGVIREIMEETNIRAETLELFALRNHKRNGVIDSYQVYRMKDLGGEPLPDGFENTEAAFLSPEEIFIEQPVTQLAKAIVKKYFSGDKHGLRLQENFIKHSPSYQLYL